MSPVIMKGIWEDRKADHEFHGRLRSEHIYALQCASHRPHGLCCALLAQSVTVAACQNQEAHLHMQRHSGFPVLLSTSAVYFAVHSLSAKSPVVLLMLNLCRLCWPCKVMQRGCRFHV